MVARVAAAGQVVVLGQALEVAAGQVVQEQIVVDLEQNAETLLQVVLDLFLALQQLRQRAVETILGDGAVGNTEEFFESGGSVPVLGEGELAAGLAQAVDDLDGHHVGRSHCFLALRHMAGDDVVQAQVVPQPARQPDIAEATGVAPADGAQANAGDIGIVVQRHVLQIGKEAQLLSFALAVVKNHGALPAPFLSAVEFAEVSNDVLTRPGLGAETFDESIIGVGLAVLAAAVGT